jgi:hypothetical protein
MVTANVNDSYFKQKIRDDVNRSDNWFMQEWLAG